MDDWVKELVEKARDAESVDYEQDQRPLHDPEENESMAPAILEKLVSELEKQLCLFNEYVGSAPSKRFDVHKTLRGGIFARKLMYPAVTFKIGLDPARRWIECEISKQASAESSSTSSHGVWKLKLDNDDNVYILQDGIPSTVEQAVEAFLRPVLSFALRPTP